MGTVFSLLLLISWCSVFVYFFVYLYFLFSILIPFSPTFLLITQIMEEPR
jgi:hypothetical protein